MSQPIKDRQVTVTPTMHRLLAMHDEINTFLGSKGKTMCIEDRGRLELLRYAICDVLGNKVQM